MEEFVVLVDENDQAIGLEEKLKAHQLGLLHRALSVLIFNSDKKLLLQQRAAHKYHTPSLWANTCCSHPRENESLKDATNRRLQEEMGMIAELKPAFTFLYKADFDNGLIEHEFDHVWIGYSDDYPIINTEEVADFKWLSLDEIDQDILEHPEKYTAWFKILMKDHGQKLREYESL